MHYIILSIICKQIQSHNTIENAIMLKQLSVDQKKYIKAHKNNYKKLAANTKQLQDIYIGHYTELTTLLLHVVGQMHRQSIENLKKHINELSRWYREYCIITTALTANNIFLDYFSQKFIFMSKTFDYSIWNTQILHNTLNECGKTLKKYLNSSLKSQKQVKMAKVLHKQLITFYKQKLYALLTNCIYNLKTSCIEKKNEVFATINLKILLTSEEHPNIYKDNIEYFNSMTKKFHLFFGVTEKQLSIVLHEATKSIATQVKMMKYDFIQLYTEKAIRGTIINIIS